MLNFLASREKILTRKCNPFPVLALAEDPVTSPILADEKQKMFILPLNLTRDPL